METPAQRPKTRSQTRDQVNCSDVPEGEYAEAAILESPVRVPVKFTTESFRDVEPLPLTIHTEEPVAPPVLSDVELPDLHSPAQNLDPENHLPEEPATSDPPTSLVGEEEVPEGEDYLEPVPVEEEILTNDLPVEPELSLDTEVADPSTVQPEPSFGPINSPETVSNVAEPETVLRRPGRQRQPPSRLTVRMQQSRPLTRIHPLSPRRAEHLSEPVRLRPGAVDWVGVGVPREAEVLAT
uniref:Uncharacterized protein n=1 Tax=Knipowitschia caucasica TaxID=637954 RepID=A0AAV2MDZ7_KNICA